MLLLVFSLVGHTWITSAVALETVSLITAAPDANVTVNCTADMKPAVQYHAARWYKEGVDPRLTGLVSRALPGGVLRWYVGADTRIWMEEDTLSLKLPTVNCSDAGVYLCYLAAPVGEQNREGRVQLTVTGCPTEEPSEPETPEMHTDLNVERVPLEPKPTLSFLVLCGAIGMIAAFAVLAVFFLILRCLRNSLWSKTKTLEKELRPDPNSSPEKQDLLWTLGLPPKKLSEITMA